MKLMSAVLCTDINVAVLNPHGSDETHFLECDSFSWWWVLNPHGSDETFYAVEILPPDTIGS